MQIKKTPFQVSLFIWQLPILPGRFQPSTFGVCELNFRVGHVNGCILVNSRRSSALDGVILYSSDPQRTKYS